MTGWQHANNAPLAAKGDRGGAAQHRAAAIELMLRRRAMIKEPHDARLSTTLVWVCCFAAAAAAAAEPTNVRYRDSKKRYPKHSEKQTIVVVRSMEWKIPACDWSTIHASIDSRECRSVIHSQYRNAVQVSGLKS